MRNMRIDAKAWPFIEARNLLERHKNQTPEKDSVLFETGYGPSGLPHIGTFGEVARTSMVRRAFNELAPDIPTRLICFSDDMDGLRKVPDNVPNREMLRQHLQLPLTSIPDPFGEYESYAHHNNARLRAFLDRFGFDYHFASATDYYQNGRFNDTLTLVLQHHEAICRTVAKTLNPKRAESNTYSPFIPKDDQGAWKHYQLAELKPESGTIVWNTAVYWDNERGDLVETADKPLYKEMSIYDGAHKLQWRADWAMRWCALGVDYEMHGKDLTPSMQLSSRIAQIIGGTPPAGFAYELFLDAKGEKISKSKGNGLTIEEWLTYGNDQSLSLYMFQSPRKAKKLHFDVIPKAVDEYLTFLTKYPQAEAEQRYENPVWHIHAGNPPPPEQTDISFALLLNLVGACNPEDSSILWGFISRYDPSASPETHPMLANLADYAIKYYNDFVAPHKQYRTPTEAERQALQDLKAELTRLPEQADAEAIQTSIFNVGKQHQYDNLRDWFKMLYEVLLGQSQGPRLGGFFLLYGRQESIDLIDSAIQKHAA